MQVFVLPVSMKLTQTFASIYNEKRDRVIVFGLKIRKFFFNLRRKILLVKFHSIKFISDKNYIHRNKLVLTFSIFNYIEPAYKTGLYFWLPFSFPIFFPINWIISLFYSENIIVSMLEFLQELKNYIYFSFNEMKCI